MWPPWQPRSHLGQSLSTGIHETLPVPGPVVSVKLAVADASAAAASRQWVERR